MAGGVPVISWSEEREQVGVIGAADEWLADCGEVIGGGRAAVGTWLVAVRVAGRTDEALLTVEHYQSGWEVSDAEYGIADGEAIRRAWAIAV